MFHIFFRIFADFFFRFFRTFFLFFSAFFLLFTQVCVLFIAFTFIAFTFFYLPFYLLHFFFCVRDWHPPTHSSLRWEGEEGWGGDHSQRKSTRIAKQKFSDKYAKNGTIFARIGENYYEESVSLKNVENFKKPIPAGLAANLCSPPGGLPPAAANPCRLVGGGAGGRDQRWDQARWDLSRGGTGTCVQRSYWNPSAHHCFCT